MPAGTGALLRNIALHTTVIYRVVLAGVRLSGKREVGQMTRFDLTLLLLTSNSVQNAMPGPGTSLRGAWSRHRPVAAELPDCRRLRCKAAASASSFRDNPASRRTTEKIIGSHRAQEHVSMDELERVTRVRHFQLSRSSPGSFGSGCLDQLPEIRRDQIRREYSPRTAPAISKDVYLGFYFVSTIALGWS
jgi:hypothetical protein